MIDFKNTIVTVCCALTATMASAQAEPLPVPAKDVTTVTLTQHYPLSAKMGAFQSDTMNIVWSFILNPTDRTAMLTHPVADPEATDDSYRLNGRYHFEKYSGDANGGPYTSYTRNFYALWTPMIDRDYHHLDPDSPLRNDSWMMSAIRVPSTFEHEGQTYTVTAIGDSAFAGSNIVTVHVPSTVTSIGDYAFADCVDFAGLPDAASAYEVVPGSVTSLGRGVFKGCTTMDRMSIGDGVRVLPEETFDGCTNMKRLTLGRNVERISCLIPPRLYRIAFKGARKPEMLRDGFESWTKVWVDERYAAAFPASWNANTYSIVPERDSLIFYKGHFHPVNFTMTSANEWTNTQVHHMFGYPGINYGGGIEPYREVTLVFAHNQFAGDKQSNDLIAPPYRVDFSDDAAYLFAEGLEYNRDTRKGTFKIAMRTLGDQSVTVTGVDATEASYTWPVKVIEGVPVTKITIDGPLTVEIGGTTMKYTASCIYEGSADSQQPLVPSRTDVLWSCDTPDMLTIDADGTVHPLKAGFATIRATSADPACYSVAAILTVRVDDGNAVKYTVKQTVPTAPYTVSMNGNNIDAKSIKKRTVSTDFYYFFNSDGTAEITYPGANRHDTFDNNEQIPATPYEFDFPGHEPVRTVKADGTLGDFCFYTSTITNFLLRHSSTTTNYLEAFRSSLYIETMPYTAVENPDGIQQATLYRANRIGNHAFAGSNIRYISFYDDFEAQLKRPQIEEIGDYAFLNCKEFRGIFPGSHDRVVPKTVKKIGRGVFKGCEKMSSMIIGDSVEVIPEETFDGCTSLTRLTLGKSVKEVNCAIKCDTIIIRSAKVPAFNRGVTANTLTTAPVVYYIEGNEAPEAGAGKTFSEANALHFNVSPEKMYLFTNTTGRADVDIKSISDPDRQWGTGIAGHYPYPKVNGITFNRYADKDKAPGWTPVITGEWPSDARAIGPNIAGGNFDTYTSIKFLNPSPNNGAKPFSILLRANDGSEQEITLPVHVKDGKKVTGISLISNKGNFVKPGDQCILTVIRQPGNINDQDHTSYRDKYQFTSSDESVATVAPVGVVTAHKVGNVTITCRLNDPYSGYPEATFELSVRKEGTAIPSRTWKYHFPVKDGDIVMGNITRTAVDFSFLPIEAPEGEIPGAMITFPGATQERIAELIGNDGATLPLPDEKPYNTPYTFAYPGYTNRQLVAPHLATTVTRKVSEWIETLKNPSGQYYKSTYRFQLDVPATIEVGDSKYAVRAISAGAFANSNIAHIDIPEGVEEIGDYAFAEAKDFVGIETNAHNTIIPNTVKKIGKGLFRGCTAMTSMIIGDGVEVIPEATFDGCNNLKSVGIGKNVKQINCDIKLISTDSKDYTILAFQSKEPPTLKEGCSIEATNVKVPEGSEEAYKKAFPHLATRMKSFKLSFTEKDKKLTAYAGQRIPLKYSIQELPTDAVTFDFIYPAEPGSPTSPPFNGTVSGSSVGVGGETGRRFTIEYSDLDEVLAGNIIAHSNISIDVKYKNVGEHQVILTWLDVTRASDTITVSTVEGVPVERIIISAPPSIRPGATATATARLLGYNGMTPTNPKIHWQSLNPDVLEIDRETGEFKGLKTGKATIVCHSDDPLSGVDEEATIEVCELIQTVKLMVVDDEGNELFEIKPLGAPGTTSDDDCGIYEWTGNKVRLKRVLYPEGVLEPALSEQTWSSTCEAENPTFATNFTTTGDDAQPAYDPENMVIDCLHGYAPGDREDYEYELLVLNIKGIRMLDGNDFTARYPIRVKTEMKDIDIEVPQPPAPDLPGA
ncbi:leucine-rich repeat protein, partial [Paramuribaculum intestinale]